MHSHRFSLSITNVIDFLLINYSFCKHRRYKTNSSAGRPLCVYLLLVVVHPHKVFTQIECPPINFGLLSAEMFLWKIVFSFFLCFGFAQHKLHFTFSSIHLGVQGFCKLFWRQRNFLPLKRSDQICLQNVSWLKTEVDTFRRGGNLRNDLTLKQNLSH